MFTLAYTTFKSMIVKWQIYFVKPTLFLWDGGGVLETLSYTQTDKDLLA